MMEMMDDETQNGVKPRQKLSATKARDTALGGLCAGVFLERFCLL